MPRDCYTLPCRNHTGGLRAALALPTQRLWEFAQRYGGYLDHATKGFAQNMAAERRWPACGADDSMANCLTKAPPLVACYAGTGLVAQKVSEVRACERPPWLWSGFRPLSSCRG